LVGVFGDKFLEENMKKVVIDARLAGLKNAGIGRYIQMLMEHLEQINRLIDKPINIQTIRTGPRHYSLKEQLLFSSILKREHPDLVHFPHFNVPLLYNKPFVVTIHDLLWHERIGFSATTLPKWMYLIKYLGYRMVLRHAVLKSKAIIVPSEWVKNKIVERFSEVEGKINVIYEGVSDIFKRSLRATVGSAAISEIATSSLDKLRAPRNDEFIIYTGSLYPHKNVGIILNVLKHFSDLKLVVACARSVFWEKFKLEVDRRCLEDRVVLAGFVSDEELVGLYRRAIAFVFPSLSEGFGLPGLEAMAAGLPLLVPDALGFPEAVENGKNGYLADPDNIEDWVEKAEKILFSPVLQNSMRKYSRYLAETKFSWEECARENLKVYRQICIGHRERP